MKYIFGIGNPGKKYEHTRHNIGFRALDGIPVAMKIRSGIWRYKKELQADIFSTEAAVLVKPETYVNRIGDSVSAILRHYDASMSDFLFVCDDVNLAFGKLRLRESGSAGGHHGLESIIEHLKSEEFPRLRVGVGNDKMPKDLTSFVLEEFSTAEKKELEKILEKAVSVCETWINKGFESARNRLSQLQSVK